MVNVFFVTVISLKILGARPGIGSIKSASNVLKTGFTDKELDACQSMTNAELQIKTENVLLAIMGIN